MTPVTGEVTVAFRCTSRARRSDASIGGGEVALRDAGPVRRLRRVQPLAGERASLEEHLGAVGFERGVGQRRFGSLERGLGHRDRRRRRIGLGIDLAAVDRGDGLSFVHGIADLDQNALERAREPRFHRHPCAGRQRARDLERGFDRAHRSRDDRYVHGRDDGLCGRALPGFGRLARGRHRREHEERRNEDTTIHEELRRVRRADDRHGIHAG
jgi:hypothetical protein